MSSLFGQLAQDKGSLTEKQWIWIVKRSEEETHRRLLAGERPGFTSFRPLGIRFLKWLCFEKMKESQDWPVRPTEEGFRRRVQELADPRMFFPTPLSHVGDSQHKILELDPNNSAAFVGGGWYQMQSGYLLNPLWYMEQGIWPWFEITKDFAFKVLKVDNMVDLKRVLGMNSEVEIER